ncbi:hypothetical protein B0A54_06519 [Friedmanniomyces endolithicus]|uniref:Uncharacterized protein n=1 Tax=Friedmanniomyces endolithicus TaxID=329885 RepID=A0A4U0UZE8_9PEZI|nr:hypothetical protein B0A54_06519 [Friedmanniomyces endolithicus]
MGGIGRKRVHFDLPADTATPAQPSFEAVIIEPRTSAKPAKRKASSAADGRYEVRNTKRTEYYGDGRKVTVYKKTYSYWA